jgi:hypothetical protein
MILRADRARLRDQRPNQAMERTAGSPEERLNLKLESRKQKRERSPASRRSSSSR